MKKDSDKGEYDVCFEARDDDAMQATFAEYTVKTMHHKAPEKTSVRQQLSHFKEVVKNMARDTARDRNRGGMSCEV